MNKNGYQTVDTSSKKVRYHDRLLYQTMLGEIWVLPRTVTVSRGVFRLEFVFDDDEEKLNLLAGASRVTNVEGEVIVYSFPIIVEE
ncbi:hypothetical protein [Brevibacillus sp. FIR094]|uniref:hypothetical protein n=1 Tax=Brevibacillus sp. FIR094 TaxID=3134809 RepID=UPI003D1A7013